MEKISLNHAQLLCAVIIVFSMGGSKAFRSPIPTFYDQKAVDLQLTRQDISLVFKFGRCFSIPKFRSQLHPFKEVCYSSFYYTIVKCIFDNMMSRLILTLTKQFFDNQLTHFKINTWEVLYTMQVVKGTIFCCVRSSRRKCYNICYFS